MNEFLNILDSTQMNAIKQYIENDIKITMELYESLCKQPTTHKAWVLKMRPRVIRVVCESCHKKGFVQDSCPVCGGKGSHKKTQMAWTVSPNQIDIEKIDRDPKTGMLRYWTSLSEFFCETTSHAPYQGYPYGVHFVHFNYKEAVNEADRLNSILRERGELV